MSSSKPRARPADVRLREQLRQSAERLSQRVGELRFADPITHVYNPLEYAWELHVRYIDQVFASADVLLLGMNPGPWGMAQTGVPFGEVDAVRNWMGIDGEIAEVDGQHPKRPLEGFGCQRSEVSGRRLWGLMGERFPEPSDFFRKQFVLNYCPLVFMESSGRNRTPDKLPPDERAALQQHCDQHLREVIDCLPWQHLVGVGAFAETCLRRVTDADSAATISRILHPSPASPAANRDWSGTVTKQLQTASVW